MARRNDHILYGLPDEIRNKINKTKQTRGAQPSDRVVYQNRVNRNGIAVVPYAFRNQLHPAGFEKGHVFMVRPEEYFARPRRKRPDFDPAVKIGENAFVYYDNRHYFDECPPLPSWRPRQRGGPGEVVFRIPATTARDAQQAAKKVEGDPQGIRFYEYAPTEELHMVCVQLALLAWSTAGIDEVRTDGGSGDPPAHLVEEARRLDLWRVADLKRLGVLSEEGKAICPLCRETASAELLMSRVQQAEGREVYDLTITEANLFHMKDLKPGEYNHRAYLVGWGHHHCNIVARDNGVAETIRWMAAVLERNGYTVRRP